MGTIEPYHSWYPLPEPYRLDYWPDWEEWYADVSAAGFRSAIVGRIAPQLLRKGFDGLFLDNTDMIRTIPGRRGDADARRSARAARARRGGLLFGQNGINSIGPTLRYYDELEAGGRHLDLRLSHAQRLRPAAAGSVERRPGRAAPVRGARLLVLASGYVAARDAATPDGDRDTCSAGALPFMTTST